MLVIFDTDVIVSAMRSPTGASAELLRRVRLGTLHCGVSVALAMEYETVCLRDEHVQASGLSVQDAALFVDAVIAMAQPVQVHYRWRPQLRDPSDEMVLEAAVNASADALLTFNLRHFQVAAKTFGLSVQRPGEFLRSIP
jgi:putative PIN family toxin of toxin-antitoxin system